MTDPRIIEAAGAIGGALVLMHLMSKRDQALGRRAIQKETPKHIKVRHDQLLNAKNRMLLDNMPKFVAPYGFLLRTYDGPEMDSYRPARRAEKGFVLQPRAPDLQSAYRSMQRLVREGYINNLHTENAKKHIQGAGGLITGAV